jgi:gliding motility-associated-like protein
LTIDWLNVDFISDAPKCEGQLVNFTDQSVSSNNTPITNWFWDFDNATTSVNQNPSSQYLTSGNYSVKLVVNTPGCSDSIIRNVTINPAPQVDAGVDTSICGNGLSYDLNGVVNIASGGIWSTTATGNFVNPNVLSTTYNIGLGDTSGAHYFVLETIGNGICPAAQDSILITFIPGPILIPPADQTVCFGDTAKNITPIVYGGTLPYSFLWSNGATTQSINATPGTYYVTISDGNACSPIFDTVVIDQIALPIQADAGQDQNICDYNLPLNLTGSVSGASGGHWIGAGTFTPSPDSLNATYTPTNAELSSGTFDLSLATTGNGTCLADTDSVSFRIIELSITNIDSVIPGCTQSNGSIMITHTGGDAPISYNWSGLASGQNNDTATGLPVGFYQVTVSDVNGCMVDTIINLNNNQPTLVITDTVNVKCYGGLTGSATAQGMGGVLNYTYLWDPNANAQTSATATGLAAGTYSVTVTDNINCSAVESVTITEPDDSIWVASVINDDLLCFGDSNGVISVSGSGGNGGFTYSWNTNPVQTDSFATGLSSGTYTVTLTDDSACSNAFNVDINEPSPLTINAIPNSDFNGFNISCNGLSDGSALVTGGGGVGGYSYLWNDNNSQTTASANTLSAGNYIVTVYDANNCSIDTTITLTEPTSISIQMQKDSSYNGSDISCFGDTNGYVSAQVSGGVPGYYYLWDDSTSNFQNGPLPSGTYYVTVTDTNGCVNAANISLSQPQPLSLAITGIDAKCFDSTDASISVTTSGGILAYSYQWDSLTGYQTTKTVTGLGAGVYEVTVLDANGCEIDTNYTINEPNALSVSALTSDTICPLDSHDITANAIGGNGNFIYIWDNGLDSGQTHFVSPSNTTTYSVTAYDISGCPSPPDSVAVYVRVFDPDSINMFSTGNVCSGNSSEISTDYAGAYPPYTFVWSSGHGGLGPHTVTPSIDTYFTVTITDECQNILIDSILVEVFEYPDTSILPYYIEGCPPLEVIFEDSANNPGATYEWEIDNDIVIRDSIFNYIFPSTGFYNVDVTITSVDSCVVTMNNAASIEGYPQPTVSCAVSTAQATIFEAEIQFYAYPDGLEFDWNFGDNSIDSIQLPLHEYQDTGVYVSSVIGTNSFGCQDTCFSVVVIDPSYFIDVPNAFIPDPSGGNGGTYNPQQLSNSIFFPVVESVDEFKMMIFNRWGEMVFVTDDINVGWDGYYQGELLQQDVYVYKIEARFLNGRDVVKTGDVTLIR